MAQEKFTDDFFQRIFTIEVKDIEYEHHPSFQILVDFLFKELEPKELSIVSAHIATCSECAIQMGRLQEELEHFSKDLDRILPNPLQFLTRKQTLFQKLQNLLFGSTQGARRREVISTPRWVRAWAFAATAILLVTFGTMAWLNSQVTRLNREMATIQQANESEIGVLKAEIVQLKKTLASYEEVIVSLNEKLAQQPGMSPEGGQSKEYRIVIKVNKDLTGSVRVYEETLNEVLFQGVVKNGTIMTHFGQRFEISWSKADGGDAISVSGCEKSIPSGKECNQIVKELNDIRTGPDTFVLGFP